jgi:hypothetical protein
VTSISRVLGREVDLSEVAEITARHFGDVFNRQIATEIDLDLQTSA